MANVVAQYPVEEAIRIIGGKWKLLVLRSLLLNGAQRYNELLGTVTAISPKELTRNLRELTNVGLVSAHSEPTRVARYDLTELGKSLMPTFKQLLTWGTKLDALRAKSADELLQAQSKEKDLHYSAVVDGYFLPASPTSLYASGQQNHIPLLAGWNADEGGYQMVFQKDDPTAANYATHIHTMLGDKADAFLKVYAGATDAEAKRSASDFGGDKFIGYSTWRWIELHRATSHSPVFRYEFDQAPPGQARGAYHSAEIEFVFSALPSKDLPWRPEDYRLSNMMSNYWTNFAKTGNPNGPGMPQWPAYTEAAHNPVLHLMTNPHAEPDIHRARYEFLESMSPTSR